MKVNKLIGFNANVYKKLKKITNASKLVNDLMEDYFFLGKNQEKDEILALIEKVLGEIFDREKVVRALEKQLVKLAEREKKLNLIFKNIPDKVLKDFQMFPKMTKEILENRYKNIYSKKYKLSFDKILEAFVNYSRK